MKKGITIEQARAELDILNRQYLRAQPDFGAEVGLTMRVDQLKDRLVANVRPILLMLFGAAIFVLLIACANAGGLMLARATSRSREFAIRAAVGASRFRMIRQLLIESLILAVAGGAVGVLLAKFSFAMILPMHAFDNSSRVGALFVPGSGALTIDRVVLGFTVLLSITTGILFGLFPSLRMSRPAISDSLRDGGATGDRNSSRTRAPFGLTLRSATVIGQVALSVVLLIGSTLLLKSLVRLRNVDPGFSTAGLLTAKIPLPPKRYDTDQKKAAFVRELVNRVEAVPGIDGAAIAMSLPTTPWVWTDIQVQGRPPINRDERQTAQIQSVTPEYFRTLRIALRRGRAFTLQDNTRGAVPVAIINETFARRFWPSYPNEDPIGQFISEGADKSVGRLEIVGVVSNVREGGLAFDAGPEFYVPTVVHPFQTLYLVVHTEADPLLLIQRYKSTGAIDRFGSTYL